MPFFEVHEVETMITRFGKPSTSIDINAEIICDGSRMSIVLQC